MATAASNKNINSKFLTDAEFHKLCSMMEGRTYSMCTCIAQVLVSEGLKWEVLDSGVLCFVKDHARRTFFIKLFNLAENKVSFEAEMYLEIDVLQPNRKFLTFDGHDRRIGLNFHDESECENMKIVISQKAQRRPQGASRKNNIRGRQKPPPKAPVNAVATANAIDNGEMGKTSPKREGELFGFRRKFGFKKDDKPKFVISGPTNFQRVGGYDGPSKNINDILQNNDIIELFKRNGIDLSSADAATREQATKMVERCGGVDRVTKKIQRVSVRDKQKGRNLYKPQLGTIPAAPSTGRLPPQKPPQKSGRFPRQAPPARPIKKEASQPEFNTWAAADGRPEPKREMAKPTFGGAAPPPPPPPPPVATSGPPKPPANKAPTPPRKVEPPQNNPRNDLLAGIQGFNKGQLSKTRPDAQIPDSNSQSGSGKSDKPEKIEDRMDQIRRFLEDSDREDESDDSDWDDSD